MQKVYNVLLSALCFVCSLLFFSCNKRSSIDVNVVDETAIAPDLQWALVSVPYVSFMKEPSYSSDVVSHERSGAVLPVVGKKTCKVVRYEDDDEKKAHPIVEYLVWYKFSQGWLESTQITLYDTKLKAEKSASDSFPKE